MPVKLKDSSKVQRTRLQYAAWLGNTTSIIIVADNDIFVRQSPSMEEDIRITTTGHDNNIYNGIPDWLYQGNDIYRFTSIYPNTLNWIYLLELIFCVCFLIILNYTIF